MLWDNSGLFASRFIWGWSIWSGWRWAPFRLNTKYSCRKIGAFVILFQVTFVTQSITFVHSLFPILVHFPWRNRFVNFFRSNWQYRDRKRVSASRDLQALKIDSYWQYICIYRARQSDKFTKAVAHIICYTEKTIYLNACNKIFIYGT